MGFYKHLFSAVYHLLRGLGRLNCRGMYGRKEELASIWLVTGSYYLK